MTEHEISRIDRRPDGTEIVRWRLTGRKAAILVHGMFAFLVAGTCAALVLAIYFALKLAGML